MRRELVLHPELTTRQREILRSDASTMLLTGPAGTAKTYTALARGIKHLHMGRVERIIIIRSAVPVRDMGFLPGSTEEKIDAYGEPYFDMLEKLCPKTWRELISKKMLHFRATSYLRGLTFDQAYMVIDEYQNMSAHELETCVTRVGLDTQLVLSGDSEQPDLRGHEAREHQKVIRTLTSMPECEIHSFGVEDIVRSGFVQRYFEAKALAA